MGNCLWGQDNTTWPYHDPFSTRFFVPDLGSEGLCVAEVSFGHYTGAQPQQARITAAAAIENTISAEHFKRLNASSRCAQLNSWFLRAPLRVVRARVSADMWHLVGQTFADHSLRRGSSVSKMILATAVTVDDMSLTMYASAVSTPLPAKHVQYLRSCRCKSTRAHCPCPTVCFAADPRRCLVLGGQF